MPEVRRLLLDTLAQAGFPAKSTTAEWSLVEQARKPLVPFRMPARGRTILPALGRKGRQVG